MTTETPSQEGLFLGSMRINRPAPNGGPSRPSYVTQCFEETDPGTGEVFSKEQTKSPLELRLEKWALHRAAQRLLKDKKRVCNCHRLRTSTVADVTILRNPALKSAHYGNIQTCGSVWDDPLCASKISEKRRNEVRNVIDAWEAEGGQCLLLNLTHSHGLSDALASLVKGEQAAMASMIESRPFKKLMSDMGCIGRVRAWEVTYGQNGWHPHFHILLFASTCNNLQSKTRKPAISAFFDRN